MEQSYLERKGPLMAMLGPIIIIVKVVCRMRGERVRCGKHLGEVKRAQQ